MISKYPWYNFFPVCVPITLNDLPYCVLNIYFRKPHDFSDSDLSIISIFSKYSAIAINNANLVIERNQKIKQLTALNKISFGISGELEMDSLLELIYLECKEIMDTKNFYIAIYDSKTKKINLQISFE